MEKYIKPVISVIKIETTAILNGSLGFEEGKGNGSQLARRRGDVTFWDDEDDEEL